MKNNKGFTLVELLAVLVILAAIITIAVPNVISMSKKIKVNMFCDKVNLLVTDAKLYGQDNYDDVLDGDLKTVSISTLVNNGYAKKDDNSCVVGDETKPCVKDPRDDSSLDNETLTLTMQNKRVTATFNYKNADDTKICSD